MSDASAFLVLGFRHILAPDALDHILFLLVLVAPYRMADWRHLLGVTTAFTAGHSITLVLAVTGVLRLPTGLIEFLIPVTIVLAGFENFRRLGVAPQGYVRPVVAAGFGLVHGAGFANVLRELFGGATALPLLSFNAGIELGQVAVLAAVLLTFAAIDRALITVVIRHPRGLRAGAASALAGMWAIVMAAQRLPW